MSWILSILYVDLHAITSQYLLLALFSLSCIVFCFALFSSEYGFAEKVVEGITVSVNSIVIRIGAKAFNASFELSQLRIYSVNAQWEHGDLRFTRIQDPQRGEVRGFLSY